MGFKFFANGLVASVRSLPRLCVSSNDARFNSGPEKRQQQQSSSFPEFITSERVKVEAMLALALVLCNAGRIVMSVAIVLLSLANGWSRALARIVQEKELALAASKFAECQKIIESLGLQLKSLATLEDFLLD